MSSSRSSSVLSSVLSSMSLPSDDEELPTFNFEAASTAAASPPAEMEEDSPPKKRKDRAPSPPHESILADDESIAFIVMFRSRFSDVFPAKLSQFGPQDIEDGVVDSSPSPQVESLLCALLALVLNRKKPIENGHHGRALEEAISANKLQWPKAWGGVNPLSQNRSFSTMSPQERLTLLKWLIMWSLHSSEAINNIIKDSYKQSRHDDDLNQPLSVQSWGRDGDKRRYWLIEGKDDTPFRLYRESNPALKHNTWRSAAGTIEELTAVADKLESEDGTQAARRLGTRIKNAIPRFEATEEKRKRREYRMARKAAFTRPDPGFSMYEGRTRGKRMRYTFSDEDEEDASELSESMLGTRRSTRHTGLATPADPSHPTITASGRQVRSRVGGLYGEALLSGQSTDGRGTPATDNYDNENRINGSEEPRLGGGGRHKGSNGHSKQRKHIQGYNSVDELDDEDDASSSGGEWDGGDEEEPDIVFAAASDDGGDGTDMSSGDEGGGFKSLVVTLRYRNASAGAQLPTPSPQPTMNGFSGGLPPTAPPTAPSSAGLNGYGTTNHWKAQSSPGAPPMSVESLRATQSPAALQQHTPAAAVKPISYNGSIPQHAPLQQGYIPQSTAAHHLPYSMPTAMANPGQGTQP